MGSQCPTSVLQHFSAARRKASAFKPGLSALTLLMALVSGGCTCPACKEARETKGGHRSKDLTRSYLYSENICSEEDKAIFSLSSQNCISKRGDCHPAWLHVTVQYHMRKREKELEFCGCSWLQQVPVGALHCTRSQTRNPEF